MRHWLIALAALTLGAMAPAVSAQTAPGYRNFAAAIYIAVNDARELADPATFAREFARASAQVRFSKVYLEVYRDRKFSTDAEIESVKRAFEARGIMVAGGITLAAGGRGGQFGTFDYENAVDRAECLKAVQLAAKHFDEVILDDFFFYTSKSDADIAAKGKRSWTQYRLAKMRQVSRELVLDPAHAVNPKVRMIIKYPNWYEHFQGLGYDLEKQSQMFDGIYTGTETRDPTLTDQLLQQYESYLVYRYYSNIRPGGNGGGWVDTFSTRAVDRYAEQLWDTLFAKAGEITLFNWNPMSDARPLDPGDRPWKGTPTSFDWERIARDFKGAGWGRAAGAALDIADRVLPQLGKPIGIAAYKPYQSSGEDFLHNYLGNIGLPIELYPEYPVDADTVLLTESAAADPAIIARIKASLVAGHRVIVTSGLVRALHDKGFRDIAEWTPTGNKVAIDQYVVGFGAGNGASLNGEGRVPPILFPEVRFYTNDSWAIVRGIASAKGFPIVLMNHYSKGTIYMLAVPDNQGDLYNIPQPALTQIKAFLAEGFPVAIDAPAGVALFAYDNGAFVVENYRDLASDVGLKLSGGGKIEAVDGGAAPAARLTLPPHSFRVFRRVP